MTFKKDRYLQISLLMINRTSSKTQSALFWVMEEGMISVDGLTYQLLSRFVTCATRNPFGNAGTQMLQILSWIVL